MVSRCASFVIAASAGAATMTAASAPSPLYPVYQRAWNLSSFTLTLVFAVYVFALLAALLTVGSLSDVIGRRPVVSAAMVLLAVGMLLFATAAGAGDLMVARFVQGVAVGAATGSTTAMIVDTAPDPRIGAIVSGAVPPLGIAVGAVLAGALVQFAPLPGQLVFWALAAAYLVLAALVWLVPERNRSESTTPQSIRRSLAPSAGLPSGTRAIFVASMPSILATWALAGLYLSLGASVLDTVLDVDSHFVVGVVLGSFFAAGMTGAVVSAAMPPRFREGLAHVNLGLGVVLTVAATLLGTLPLYVVGSLLAGCGFGAAFRVVVGNLADAAPAARRGQVFATMYLVSYLAFSVPALAAGLAAERFGLARTAVGYGVAIVALVVVAMVAGNRTVPAVPVLVSRCVTTPRHRTHYLDAGPADGPLVVFVHGWPGLGVMWRAQMQAFATDGWHCVAPDLRGYGASSAPADEHAYTVEAAVADMVELHDHLGGAPAIWVGHDWGSIVVGALAAHESQRCRGVVLTSWAYFPESNSLATLVPLVDRTVYPADRYPDGQWDYYRYYTTHFDSAVADLDADPAASLASVYRPGDPRSVGRPAPAATVTHSGGRFGSAHRAPATRPDAALWPTADFDVLVRAYRDGGFRSSCAWYLNGDANAAYARTASRGGRLAMPVLFVNGEYDAICTITGNRQGEPMRSACADLTVVRLSAGHWIPLESKSELVAIIRKWLDDSALR
jgi:pimeloyl-ACP methyl ester carboxylesterase/predicted MFS family arabinose efflux permease